MTSMESKTLRKDKSMLAKGFQARGDSLARLGSALSGSVTSFSGDLVAAIALARSFDTMLPDSQSKWIMHAQGLERLLSLMGPDAFARPAMRRLIENNRWAGSAGSKPPVPR